MRRLVSIHAIPTLLPRPGTAGSCLPVPEFDVEIDLIRRTLNDGLQLVQVRFHPEASLLVRLPRRLDEDDVIDEQPLEGRHLGRLRELVQTVVDDLPPIRVWQRRMGGDAEVVHIDIRIQPPEKDSHWITPADLSLQALVWEHEPKLWLAQVPALGIEVFAKDRESLDSRVRNHIRFALQRKRWATSLKPLCQLARYIHIQLERRKTKLQIATPKQIEMAEGEPNEPPVLKTVADRIDQQRLAPAFKVNTSVNLIAEAMAADMPRSVLLVGPSGVGKTAIVNELVRTRRERGLGSVSFWRTSGSRLVAGMCGFGMWQERCDKMCRELREQKAVLYAGNLPELVEAGKGGGNSQGIGEFLRNRMDRGEIVVIAECTPEQFATLERVAPGVVQSFLQLRIEEPDLKSGRQILMEYSLWAAQHQQQIREQLEYERRKQELDELRAISGEKFLKPDIRVKPKTVGEPLSVAAIEKVDRLHRRYSAYSAYPGRAIRFLYNLIEDRGDSDEVLQAPQVTEAFASETGLPAMLLDESTQLKPERVRDWFRQRVIGQVESVDVVVDLIASVKAGLTRPERPIASLLFVGPTGVGKTEMAKTIAEFFFRDRSRMVRFDMSEYADPAAVTRLVGGPGHPEGLLTSRVRDQPFGVILLDEFEKADPRFFDLLLQVLGEGRLTDAEGNLADFRNSIVIMTSNLGVEASSRGSVGFGSPPAEADEAYGRLQQHFVREVQSFLRPEMFNRIDRIVAFRPLDKNTLRTITQRELGLVQARDGIETRQIDINFGDQVIDRLVAEGHDLRYGARPLKRAIEQHLLQPLAEKFLEYDAESALQANVEAADTFDSVLSVDVKAVQKPQTANRFDRSSQSMADVIRIASQVRRQVFRLAECPVTLEARNELFRFNSVQEKRIKRYEQKIAAGQTKVPYPSADPEVAERTAILSAYMGELTRIRDEAVELENDVLGAYYADEAFERPLVEEATTDLQKQWEDLLLNAYTLTYADTADRVTLCIYFAGRSTRFGQMLVESYLEVVRRFGLRPKLYSLHQEQNLKYEPKPNELWLARPKEGQDLSPAVPLIARNLKDAKALPAQIQKENCAGIALRITGSLALPRFEAEQGRHDLKGTSRLQQCHVETSQNEVKDLLLALDYDTKASQKAKPVRTWNEKNRRVISPETQGEGLVWGRNDTTTILETLITRRLMKQAETLID